MVAKPCSMNLHFFSLVSFLCLSGFLNLSMIMDFPFLMVPPCVLTYVWNYDDDYWLALNQRHADPTLHALQCPVSLSITCLVKCLFKWNERRS